MAFGTAFIVLHGMEWTQADSRRFDCAGISEACSGSMKASFAKISTGVPQFAATFFGLTAMHMLHVTIGVIYLGVVALRKWFLPILGVIWLAGYFLIPVG